MDVRFYPSASGNPVPGDSATLDLPHCLGYYNYNKFGNNNNYMNMAEVNGVLLSAADQTFHTPSLGDEEFEIPPITPPPETDPVFGASEGSGTYSGTLDSAQPQHGQFTPQFPPQSVELPYITVSRSLMEQGGGLHHNSLPLNIGQAHVRQYHADPSVLMRSIINMNNSSAMMSQNHVTTVSQSQLSTQLGLNVTGPNVPHASPSPPASKSATPSPSSSINDEDPDDVSRILGEKRPAPDATKKPKTPKKKKKKDPNEPQKPVSAYALFFRDMQAAIKGQNPNATFGEVSKIVASMWDGLGDEQKQVYKSKTEAAKKDYLKALAAYRASLVSKAAAESAEAQAIRSVQQTLASTTLPTSLMLGAPMPQHTTQALQPAPPRTIAPKPLHLRLASDQIATSVPAVARSAPLSSPSQLSGQVGAGRTLVDGAPPSVGVGQMGSHLQVQQIHQPQMHFQHRLQHHIHQQLQQPHMQLQHMHMQQLHHHHHHHHHQSECPPPQRPPSGPQPVGSPQPGPPQQIQAHSQVLSQVSIY